MLKQPINLPFEKFNIVVVGAGGTGGNVCPQIARLIAGNSNVSMTIIDGDIVESSNLERQPYLVNDLNQNKAEILSYKLNAAFNLNTSFFPRYIESPETFNKFFEFHNKKTLNILVSTVDNHKARVLMEQYFDSKGTMIYIDSANEDYYGDVIVGAKAYEKVFLKSRAMYRPLEVFKGTQRIKNRSCEIKVLDNPQYYPTNQMAANIILKVISDIVNEQQIKSHFINFDTDLFEMYDEVEGQEEEHDLNYSSSIKKLNKWSR